MKYLNQIGTLIFFLFIFSIHTANCQSEWLEWLDITSTNLTLTSVANSDDEEKDLEAADLNNDGFVDVICVRKEPFSNSNEPPKTDLLLMNVNGELIDQTSQYAPGFLNTPTHARDLYIGDLDGDGWKDVVIANTFDQIPLFYRNLGLDAAGNWQGLSDETAFRFPSSLDDVPLICAVKAGDVTGDGFPDLYFCNYKQNSGTAKDFLYVNNGFGFFTEEAETRLGDLRNSAFGTEVELKDIDNDNDLDIIKVSTLFNVAPWNSRGVIAIFNNGNGNFSNWQNISQPFTNSPYMIEVEDFNDDGNLDLFIVDDGQDFSLISTNIIPNQEITFTENTAISSLTNGFGGNVHAVDFDLDGDLDIAVADVDVDIPPCNSARKFALLENNNGVFTDPYTGDFDWMDNVYDFAIFDLNNDGLEDILQGNCEGYTMFLSNNCDIAPSNADFDLDGISDACDPCPTNPDINCVDNTPFPTVDASLPIARQWNEMLLSSIRLDFARPTVHARNLFHSSVAMWDAWATYNNEGCTYLLGQTVDGFNCNFDGVPAPANADAALEETISYAMYRLLSHRFASSNSANNGVLLQQGYDNHMQVLGYDINFTSTNYQGGNPAALGNYIAQCLIDFGLQDNSNEQNDYANNAYAPINPPLIVDNPGNDLITDFNRWQPLTLEIFIDQGGNVVTGATPEFLSPEWGQVSPFALTDADKTIYQRDGFDYWVYHDQGPPPTLQSNGGGLSDEYKWGFSMVAMWSSHLDPSDGVQWNTSPNTMGNHIDLPNNYSDYSNFYDFENGGNPNNGHAINPATGQPYANNIVPRGDFTRVLAEFWADGPDSETPPGHWFAIMNDMVADHPSFQKRFEGTGPILDDNEWYIKSYLTLGGGMHDAAITAWGNKGWYDYLRPISAIRYMAGKGQSTNSALPNYHPEGIPLQTGYIELIASNDPLAGAGNVNVGKIKFKAWRGHEVINNVDSETAGVGWILAEEWVPYQRPSFVSPPFAGYVSGHSTFSSTAATILTSLTGDAYFPGGMGSFTAPKDEFLVFEDGPSVDVVLQWATYEDASNQSSLSRIWGGIHPPADDVPGRKMGIEIGNNAFDKAKSFFEDSNNNGTPDLCETLPCENEGDSDADGVCNDVDCAPFNPNLPATVGSACNDNDANTINDVIQSDGCSCAGVPDNNNNDCNASFTVSGNSITFLGLSNPISACKIIYPDYTTYWECNTWDAGCDITETINNIPTGDYYISLNTYDAGWNVICNIFDAVLIEGTACTDLDNDGVCAPEDCDDSNPSVPATVGTACNDNDPLTTDDVIQADGCTCEGIISGDDCNASYVVNGSSITFSGLTNPVNAVKIVNPDFTTYWECNTWADACNSSETVNNIPEGSYFISLNTYDAGWDIICNIFDAVVIEGVACTDNDGDGFCLADDCDDNDANFPASVGSACNDNNPNTDNDVILGDGCTCEGTITDSGCTATFSVSAGTISINNLTDPVLAVKVLETDYTLIWECNSWAEPCNSAEVINNLAPGSYIISLNTYDAGWNSICNIFEVVEVDGNNCPDADNDGICNAADCAPNDPALPATVGSACVDGNPNTINDVILSDGCTCEGTPASGCVTDYSVSGTSVTFNNINDPNSSIKILNPDFSTYWECSTLNNPCGNLETVSNIPDGSYFISLITYDANWDVVCNIFDALTISDGLPFVQPATIGNPVLEDFIVYPNPVREVLSIKLMAPLDQTVVYELLTIEGKSVLRNQIDLEIGSTGFEIDLLQLEKGYYFLKLLTDGKVLSKPIIKM